MAIVAAPATASPRPDALLAAVATALHTVETLPPDSVARTTAARALTACRPPSAADSGPAVLEACRDALAGVYDALASDAASDDRATRGLARMWRPVVADALVRIGRASTAADPHDARHATIAVSPDGLELRVRPAPPLRAGRHYELAVRGIPEGVAASWHAGLGTQAADTLAPRLDAARDAASPGTRPTYRDQDVRALVERVTRGLASDDAVSPAVEFRAPLARPLTGHELAAVRAWFVPAGTAPDPDAVLRFRTGEPRRPLVRARAALAELPCTPHATLQPVGTPSGDTAMAGIFRGEYHTTTAEPGADRVPVTHSFLLALPRSFSANTPVVLTVHGHGGRADAMLRSIARPLATYGLATLAIDLPAHGTRADEAERIDPLDPTSAARSIRQATVDALGAIDTVTRCGLALPDGTRLAPPSVRYLGYSLGGAVGILARSVEPRISTTVLVAPAADLVEWQVQQVPKRLGVETYTVCSSGPAHGTPCATRDACGASGTCVFDPAVMLLIDALAQPYRLAFAAVDPLAFAAQRTGGSTAPLLLIAGALDIEVGTLTAHRLADAYGWTDEGDGARRGRAHRLESMASSGHEVFGAPGVRAEVARFLASGGRTLPPPAPGTAP